VYKEQLSAGPLSSHCATQRKRIAKGKSVLQSYSGSALSYRCKRITTVAVVVDIFAVRGVVANSALQLLLAS
jgi:hypothetical protein